MRRGSGHRDRDERGPRSREITMTERGASTKTVVRILIALLVLAGIVALIVYLTRGPKTTIRITKGRPGVSTIWEAGRGGDLERLNATTPIRPEVWRGMKSKIESFRYTGCDGKSKPVMELRYETQAGDGASVDVDLTAVDRDGEQGNGLYLNWNYPGCSDEAVECTLPAYLFDPTHYANGEEGCKDQNAKEVWTITLR
jgi:hypothetical protein